MSGEGPIHAYRARLSAAEWAPDPAQELAVEKLQTLHNRLRSYRAVKGATWRERNRELFVPFIDLVNEGLEVMCFDGARDYRLDRLRSTPVFFAPLGPETDAALAAAFARLADGAVAEPAAVEVQGRALDLAAAGGIAWSTFETLCGQALGAADYLEVARQFHTVFLIGVPMLGPERNDEARRFINLIDVLYEHRVNLLCGAQAAPGGLYDGAKAPPAFARTVSRLEEMQSETYLAAPHLG